MSRILLKISGEALKSNQENVSKERLAMISSLIKMLRSNNHQVGIIIGGGNFFRGRSHPEMSPINRDTIGMLGTVMNALFIHDYLKEQKIPSCVSTPFIFPDLVPNYDDATLKNMYDENKIIIFGGGLGKSGYSTDSGTILATQILDVDLIIKLTNVNGVYDSDPKVNPQAKFLPSLTYAEIIKNNYQVMDLDAIKFCQKRKIKILVMNFLDYAKIPQYFEGKNIGTIVKE